MSDPIAQAAEAMNAASIDPTPPAAGAVLAEPPAADMHVPDVSPSPVTGNVLVNSTPMVDSPNVAPAAAAGAPEAGAAPAAGGDELPRESHLMLLEHKLGIVRAKLLNAERVSLDEFEGILVHIRAVL